MKLHTYPLILLCCIIFQTNSIAQKNYKQDSAFFQNQVLVYQGWIEKQQLETYFQVKKEPIIIRDTRVLLNLTFLFEGIDVSINAIRQLERLYQEKTGFSLEESLFQKAVHLFEVPPEDLVVRVRSIPSIEGVGVDSRLLYKKDLKTGDFIITPFSILRTEVKDSVIIEDIDLEAGLLLREEVSMNDVDYRQKERDICSRIQLKAKEYFESKGGVFYSFPIGTNTVVFEAKNVKDEVVEFGIFPILNPHERLSFTVKILPYDSNGLMVLIKIDGKYGPALFRPRSNDYHEMAPKFQSALEKYIVKFSNVKIRNWIISY